MTPHSTPFPGIRLIGEIWGRTCPLWVERDPRTERKSLYSQCGEVSRNAPITLEVSASVSAEEVKAVADILRGLGYTRGDIKTIEAAS